MQRSSIILPLQCALNKPLRRAHLSICQATHLQRQTQNKIKMSLKTTRFYFTCSASAHAQLQADPYFTQFASFSREDHFCGLVRLTAKNKCALPTIRHKYSDLSVSWTLPEKFMEFGWLVQRMKEDHPHAITRGRVRTWSISTQQRERASMAVSSFWNNMKQKVEAGELEWVQKTFPKFWETRQDYINKHKP